MNSKNSESEIDKFTEVEIDKLFDAVLTTQRQRLQLATFIGTISLGILGIAFTNKISLPFFLAASLLVVFMVIDMVGYSALLRLYFRSLEIQKKVRGNESNTFLSILLIGRIEKQVKEILQIKNREKQIAALRSLPVKHPSPFGFWLPLLVLIIEIIMGLIFWLHFGWEIISVTQIP